MESSTQQQPQQIAAFQKFSGEQMVQFLFTHKYGLTVRTMEQTCEVLLQLKISLLPVIIFGFIGIINSKAWIHKTTIPLLTNSRYQLICLSNRQECFQKILRLASTTINHFGRRPVPATL